MADRRANIDILFRNGLKDYEVLPPAGAWDVIRPAVVKKQTPYLILRYAASVAVLLSVGLLAYKWSMSLQVSDNNSFAFTPESENRLISSPASRPASTAMAISSLPKNTEANSAASAEDNTVAEVPAEAVNPVRIGKLSLKGDIRTINNNKLVLKERKPAVYSDFSMITPLYNPGPELKTVEPAAQHKWSVAALVSPTYYSGINPGNNAFTNLLVSEEQPVISYSGGFALAYKLSKRFSVQSGLYYSSLGNELSGISSFSGFQRYDYTKGDHNFEVQTSNGTVYTSSSDIFLIDKISEARINTRYTTDVFDPTKANLQYLDNSLFQNFGYLEFPLVFKYKIIDKTLGFNLIGGLSSNFLVNNAVYSTLNGDKLEIGKTEGMNTLSFSSSLGMGMEYALGKNLSLNLEPTFRYYLNPYSGADGMRLHPYTFGIFSGLSYKF
jgi:hypothetical protein